MLLEHEAFSAVVQFYRIPVVVGGEHTDAGALAEGGGGDGGEAGSGAFSDVGGLKNDARMVGEIILHAEADKQAEDRG